MIPKKAASEVSQIYSHRVSFPGVKGSLIVGYLDESPNENWNGRIAILTPKYGETKKNNLRLAYFLVANGFKVLRFDHTNHIGESDGDMSQFTLPEAAADIIDSLDYVEAHFKTDEIILISNSLSARCAYRAAAIDQRISRVVCIVGVVNLQKTICNIYQKDIIGTFCEGKEWGVIDILGFDIDSANFISKMVEHNMHEVSGAIKDASKIKQPLLHLHAAKDIWVDREEVELVVTTAGGELFEIEGAYHEVGENPEASRLTLEKVARFCLAGLQNINTELAHPAKIALFEQNKKERNRLKELYVVKETENDFWNGYLGKFGTIEQAQVYIEYFEKVQKLLGTIHEGEAVLDAGCGNGFFGLCMLHTLESALGTKSDFPHSFVYYGIDLTPGGLDKALVRQSQVKSKLQSSFKDKPAVTLAYQRLDFEKIGADQKPSSRLPFTDGCFAKVCCSLVISYLKEPVHFVQELRRVLQKGGTAVLSSMKPECDMTVLYHEFITLDVASSEHENDAQKLLGAAGQIKLKEQSGIYGFYSEEELVEIVKKAGFTEYELFRSLGDQANLIRVKK
jgi:SAM-dependent methyltransferase/alpha-beta hydrolase superfamily lysophospholipase